jgi:hypothetical protein
MSLLLDALRRAEQEKLARGDRSESESNSKIAREPAPQAPDGLELQPLSPAPGSAGGKAQPSQQAAQVVFQAKAAPPAPPPLPRAEWRA